MGTIHVTHCLMEYSLALDVHTGGRGITRPWLDSVFCEGHNVCGPARMIFFSVVSWCSLGTPD